MYNLDFYKIQALYNTQIRNVGLYLSISLALLGYSRYYRGKDDNVSDVYDLSFILLSLVFMCISLFICYNILYLISFTTFKWYLLTFCSCTSRFYKFFFTIFFLHSISTNFISFFICI